MKRLERTTEVPLEVRRAVMKLVADCGTRAAYVRLHLAPDVVDEARVPHGKLTPRSLVKLAGKLVELGLLSRDSWI